MAIIVAVTSADTFRGTAASLSVPVPTNVDGDSVWIFWAARSTGATITETGDGGFSTTATAVTGGLWKSGFFHKVNSGSAVSTITISSTSTTYLSAIVFSVRGSAASPVGATASATTAGATTLQSPALTTTAANSLILHGIISESSLAQPETGTHSALAITNTGSGYAIGSSDFVAGSGASIPQVYYNQTTSRAAIAWAIEVKDSGGNLPIRITPNRTVLAYHGSYDRSAITTSAPNSVTGLTAISGVSMATAAITMSSSSPSSSGWLYAGLRMESSSATTEWQGVFESHSVNLSGKILVVPYGNSWGYTNTRFGVYGQIVVLVDSSNNWAAYTLASRADLTLAGSGYLKFIKVGSTTPLDSGGTLDPANIVKIGYFLHRNASGGTGTYYGYIGQLYYENSPAVFIGGSSALPLTNAKIAAYMSNQTQWASIAPLQGGGQYLAYLSAQIGDGTNKTYYKSTGQSYEFPRTAGATWALAANDIGLTLKGTSGCMFDLSASIFSANSVQNFTVDAASSTSATYNFIGASFIGLDWASNASINYSSTSFSNCNLAELGGGTITDSSVYVPQGSTSATMSISGGTLNNVTISATKSDGTSADYHLTLGTSVTVVTLTDVTFSGTAGVKKVRVLKTTGTVTININGTTSLSAGDVSSAGATVSIVSSPVYQSVTISGAVAGSRIQIYDTTSSTELYNGTPTFPYTWTDASPAAADRTIRLRCAYVSGTSAKNFIDPTIGTCGQTSGTAGVSYLVSQTNDTTYNSNAIDGPAIYATSGITFTDATPDRVNCNIAGGSVTYPTIYACFVYWTFTATGIADDFAYIDAPDTANYWLSGMKIRNVSATDLTVTGGYGRDSSTGFSKDIIDTAGSTGNVFLAPDHVTPYQTTGTYAITGDISTVLAAISTLPTESGLTLPQFLALK